MERLTIEIAGLVALLHLIDTLSYSIRLNAIKSGQFALSTSLFNPPVPLGRPSLSGDYRSGAARQATVRRLRNITIGRLDKRLCTASRQAICDGSNARGDVRREQAAVNTHANRHPDGLKERDGGQSDPALSLWHRLLHNEIIVEQHAEAKPNDD